LQIAEAESGARRQGFAPVALDTLVADVVDLYAAVAEEQDATLTFEAGGEDGPQLLGDRDLLAGAIANLVDNALKYAGEGAVVQLRTTRGDGEVVLLVQDNGSGIAPEDRPRAGTRFFRRNPGLPGYGLGLSSVFAVVRLHGGSHQLADTEPGAARPGLQVRIALPLHPPSN
ncbi:MAG: HAMP domain-containing histidine kinase, partial [Haliea sp.]